MGRMKDKLGETPPTIGDCRREGMTTLSVHCAAPCGRTSQVTFDALRLPDETIFIDIPKKCRLRCTSCDRRATEISANWNEVILYGTGKRLEGPSGDVAGEEIERARAARRRISG